MAAGATLQVQNNITINTEGLTLAGNGAAEVQQVLLTDIADPFTLSFNGKATGLLPPTIGASGLQRRSML